MKVKIKKIKNEARIPSVIPSYAHEGDAGLDIVANDMVYDPAAGMVEYNTGIALEIPEGYVGLLFPRSSVSKKSMILANSVGVIDSTYRGEIKIKFRTLPTKQPPYDIGEKVAQLIIIPYPKIEFEEVEETTETERGEGGFGSTDKQGE